MEKNLRQELLQLINDLRNQITILQQKLSVSEQADTVRNRILTDLQTSINNLFDKG